ncbi:hypothetical protein [Argonema antarcticum]|uniref:hypothetical protein n=1 Tax=Argonema antarcticum TaxID=2942763 RepID=UPI0020111382|nr:hypothetical protein [Argonema antarcticum]MCL1473309.1 hypothetical protein [Argonema antarcticum A004/B2]
MANKFSKERYSPSFFDLAQDITGGLPIKLVNQWLESEQTEEDALKLLAQYKIKGYSVSSDSAGLTKLTKQKGLMEILAIINQPKEIVHGYGTAIGGQGIGIWAADNTQMFYPEAVTAETLLSALLTMQDEIKKTCQIKIGLGAHLGEFYYINGGLYGLEADAIEEVAENETEGGEIAISEGIYNLLPENHQFVIEKKIAHPIIGKIFRLIDGPRLANVQPGNTKYPIPYSEDFYRDLVTYENRLHDTAFGQQLADKYMIKKVVVLIERETKEIELHQVSMLTNISLSTILKDVGMRLLSQNNGVEIKVVSNLGIYIFDDGVAAINFAKLIREELVKQDLSCRIGIDVGPVLIFDLPVGGKDIAGMPVNIASKMAQDKGKLGKLYLSAAMKELVNLNGFTEIKYTVSGVEMAAYEG